MSGGRAPSCPPGAGCPLVVACPPDEDRGGLGTFCCSVVCQCAAAAARPRNRCTASSTSCCCARKASPSCCVQSSLSFIICKVCGTEVSALTLGSHCWFCMASSSALPVTLEFSRTQRAAWTTSNG